MTLKEKIERALALKGWKQKDLAAALGISEPRLSELANQVRGPSLTRAWGFAQALGVSLDWLADPDATGDPESYSAPERELLKVAHRVGLEVAYDRIVGRPGVLMPAQPKTIGQPLKTQPAKSTGRIAKTKRGKRA